jgi:hypothetical protein
MKHFDQAHVRVPQYIGLTICSGLLSCLVAGNTFAAGPEASTSETAAAADAAARVKWRRSIEHLPLPNRSSCFTAAFPKTEWQEIPCGTAPKHPFLPAQGRQPANVGGSSNDVVAQVPEQTLQISTAVGSFGFNTIALSETGPQYVSDNSCTVKKQNQPNVYTLQLNTNKFTIPESSPICGHVRGCQGFQQFVYANYVDASSGAPAQGAVIQYWLLNIGTFKNKKAQCPSAAWARQDLNGKLGCMQQTNMSADPRYNTSINGVQNLELAGAITGNGEENVTLWANGKPYALPAPDILGLGQNWHDAEFNVFGYGCGQGAIFQPTPQNTPTLSIVLAADYAPTPFGAGYMPLNCEKASYTQEWNNLGFSGPAQTFPADVGNGYPILYFTEALGASAGASCAPPPSYPPPIQGSGGGGSDQCMRNGLIVPCATCNFSNVPSPRSCTPCAGHCPLPQ